MLNEVNVPHFELNYKGRAWCFGLLSQSVIVSSTLEEKSAWIIWENDRSGRELEDEGYVQRTSGQRKTLNGHVLVTLPKDSAG